MLIQHTPHRSRPARFTSALFLCSVLTVAGCIAALPIILQIGASMLQVCLENYGYKQKGLLSSLLLALSSNNSVQPSESESVVPDESETKSSGPLATKGKDLKTIGLDVALLKRTLVNGTPQLIPVKDGDLLKDSRGNPQAGDKFRILFRADTDCYIYVIAIDATAWAQGLFPTVDKSFTNPVLKGQTYSLPRGVNWYSLDQYRGIQHVYFVASQQRRPDIEDLLLKIMGLERDPGDAPETVRSPVVLPDGHGHTGSGHVTLGQALSRGPTEHVESKTYFAKTAGEALRVTRWFRHR